MKLETRLDRCKRIAEEGTYDPDDLRDIRDVKIDERLPTEERIREFIRQIKNPYVFKHGDMVVRVKFTGTDSLEQCLGHNLSMSMYATD